MTCVSLTFALHSENGMPNIAPLMCCMYATYKVIRSNKEEATERTQQKLQMSHVTLIFGPENGAQHIAPSCV